MSGLPFMIPKLVVSIEIDQKVIGPYQKILVVNWIHMKNELDLRRGAQIALFNLLIVGVIGSLLRFHFLQPIPGFNYMFVLHGHSHLAFLGWVFMGFFSLLVFTYLPAIRYKSGKYVWLFFVFQFANFGMLVAFPLTGYALWSIIFTAIHAFSAMYFAWIFIREVKPDLPDAHRASFLFVKWALILMLISNLAPFALGPVSSIYGKSDLYHSLIYFYLHFQYNGWFTFATMGLLLWHLERKGVKTQTALVRYGFYLKLVAVFPAYILSTLWMEPGSIWYFLAGVAAIIQLVGMGCFLVFILRHLDSLVTSDLVWQKLLFWCGMLAASVQHILQCLSSIPNVGDLAFARPIVIAYLHLVLIGFISSWMFLHFLKLGLVRLTAVTKVGLGMFLSAFVATELILVFQSLVPRSHLMLFVLALIQVAGICCIAFQSEKMISHEKALAQ